MRHGRSTLRRGSFLTEIVLLLPLIAATLMMVFQISSRAVRLQGQTIRALAAEAQRDDLVRRIRDDAAAAKTAGLAQTAEAATLTLWATQPDTQPAATSSPTGPRIEYRASGSQVIRIEQPAEGPRTVYEWDLGTSDVRFGVETIGEQPRVAWVSFVPRQRQPDAEHGPSWPLTTAMALDQGGAR